MLNLTIRSNFSIRNFSKYLLNGWFLSNRTKIKHCCLHNGWENIGRRSLSNLKSFCTESGKFDASAENIVESFDDIGEPEIFADDFNKFHNLKDLLYPNSSDVLIQKINNCKNSQEVLHLLESSVAAYKAKHAVQTVLMFWSFRKNNELNQLSGEEIQIFKKCLKTLSNYINDMNMDELTCSFLYLQKLGFDVGHPTMSDLLLQISDHITNDSIIPLTALSRFCVAVSYSSDLYMPLVCKDILKHITKLIDCCQDTEELRLITICLQHLHQMISTDILNIYKAKVNLLIETNVLTNDSIFETHLEPAELVPQLSKCAASILKDSTSPEMFACAIQFTLPNLREDTVREANKLILSLAKETWTDSTSLSLFKILRSLKISDTNICDAYWSKVLSDIRTESNSLESYQLARYCHRYMHFNNNLGGTYRHKGFEETMIAILLKEIKIGFPSIIPSKFAKFSAFIIGYGNGEDVQNRIPDFIVKKIEAMTDQLTIYDCLQISRGLEIAIEMRFRKRIPPEVALQINRIQVVLNNCVERQLKNDLSLIEINYIIRSYNNRKASRKTRIYQRAMKLYETVPAQLNSRIVRDIVFNMNVSKSIIPRICEKTMDYIVENRNFVTGDTVEKVLTCFYNIGYMPTNDDALYCSADIINRDFEHMNEISILKSCLALSFYRTIPEQLINRVFTIDFIKRIEDRIQNCYSKETHPERILNQLMQLNRAVCLDFPETKVPWFQQNYIEAQMSKLPVIKTKFYNEVRGFLSSLIPEKSILRCNHTTPYGYRIDFVVHFDSQQKLIPPPKETVNLSKITKVAILLLRMDAFCENDFTHMTGPEVLRFRHLEMLGYKVVHINFNDWNSMYMNIPGAKINYLKNLLQISSSQTYCS